MSQLRVEWGVNWLFWGNFHFFVDKTGVDKNEVTWSMHLKWGITDIFTTNLKYSLFWRISFVNMCSCNRRHSVYSGDSSDDSGIGETDSASVPRRFSSYFSKKRSSSRKELCVSRLFFAQDQCTFLNLCLADSDLDGALPILAYLLEPVQTTV